MMPERYSEKRSAIPLTDCLQHRIQIGDAAQQKKKDDEPFLDDQPLDIIRAFFAHKDPTAFNNNSDVFLYILLLRRFGD